ncbi:copper homeostasis protein CutC [Brevibacillus daliensis]|uniref:copper homeostasis protein CutC n=1 Tax=Brevibacillus daliensis TaxID=2892995 RepID=UPI001E3AC4C3|nr:copper homeostasis protein CutC [Brevibacillus daliensis]
MLLEVIATTLDDAKRAEAGGADRLELITGILEGGVTPSYGLIEQVVKQVSIPVNVMVRPHSQSFCYTSDDVAVMKRDVQVIRELGATGIVMGMLTPAGEIDIPALEELLRESGNMDVTFHRAFDEARNQMETLKKLLTYQQINRILTSGGKPSALNAKDEIKQMVECTKETHLNILAGSGLKMDSISSFVEETGVVEIHFGTGVREEGLALKPVDPQKVAELKRLITS